MKRTEVNFCVLVLVDEITSSPSLLIRFFSCSEAGSNIHVEIETEREEYYHDERLMNT